MASSEGVAVPVGEVVMVKAEGEGDPDDPNKTQVILQLQPISTGFVGHMLGSPAFNQTAER